MADPHAFTLGTRIAARKRATIKGVLTCEGCGEPILNGDSRVDHIIAKGLRGSRELSNAQVLGKCCYALKDATDNAVVKRCARIEKKHLGLVESKSESNLRSRGFAPRPERPSPCAPTSKTLPRRML